VSAYIGGPTLTDALAHAPKRAVIGSLVFAGLVGCGEAGGPRVATRFVLTGLPSSVISGTVVTVTVTAKDASGITVTDYSGTVHLTSTDPAAELPLTSYTFVSVDVGSHPWHVAFNTVGTQTVTATDVTTNSITGSETLTIADQPRCASIPPPWTQPCKPPPLVFIDNQRPDSAVVFLTWNAGDVDEYIVPAASNRCAYAFEAFNTYAGVVDDSAYFRVGVFDNTTHFVQKASSGWTVADSTPSAGYVWRGAPSSSLVLTVFPDTTAQGAWHIATSFTSTCLLY